MINTKISFTEETPKVSKRYLMEYLDKNDILYSKYKKGKKEWIIIKSKKFLPKDIIDRIKGFCFYCRMIMED